MSNFFTPARVAAAIGVCSGLGAAGTALAGALPIGGIQNAVLGAAGFFTTAVTLFKWLEGQSNWETASLGIQSYVQATSAIETKEQPSEKSPDTVGYGLAPGDRP